MTLASLALSGARSAAPTTTTGSAPVANIIEFVEEAWGLGGTPDPITGETNGMRLFPVQKIILKASYGIPLDDVEEFTITDWSRENPRQFTEKTYLEYLYDEKRSNIREVIPGVQRREMVLSLGRRSGKCVVGDTLVLTTQGVVPIRELGDPNGPEYQPLAVGVVQENSARSDSAFFYNGGVKSTVKFVTRSGYELDGTAGHRVRVMSEDGTIQWRYLDQIRVDDQIAIHRTTDLWPTQPVGLTPFHAGCDDPRVNLPTELTEEWGLLLGYLVGDGSWTKHNTVSVTVEHPETWDELKGLYSRLFGGFSVRMDKRTKNTGSIDFYSHRVREFLHKLGFSWDLARDTEHIPWAIMRSPKPVVRAFLQGLFETDGCAEKGGLCVSFSTASERLAREVQVLLLNFGVVSTRRAKWNKRYERYYHLCVRGTASCQKFMDEIGFRSHKKNGPVLASLVDAHKEGSDAENIPHQRSWCDALLQSVTRNQGGHGNRPGWRRSLLRTALGNTLKPSSKESLTYSRLGPTLAVARSLGADPEVVAHFETLQTANYFYDPVVSVTLGEAQVFDLTVPDGESFVANGMTNHNTALSACVAAYETYKLINKGDPQKFYGLPPANNIQLISIATDKDQAGLLYQEVSGHFGGCAYFGPYTANNTLSYARFQSPVDIERYGTYKDNPSAKATIKVTFRSCVAKGLRGAGNILVILDEVAHFTDKGQSSADAVYTAVTPSTSTFAPKDPKDRRKPVGDVEGRIILISSPLGRQGLFYKMFQIGMAGGKAASNMLCIQAPSWEVNPTIPASEFEKHYLKDQTAFFTEYGGEFSDRTRGWIERNSDLLTCVDPAARPQARGIPRRSYFLGLDLGLVGDGTAIAVGHLDDNGKIVLDLIEQIKAGEGKFAGKERLEFDDVADWVLDLSKRFLIQEGMFDQWAGIPFEQALSKRGLSQMKATPMNKNLTSQMFQNFKDMMWDEKLVLYDFPIAPGEGHCPYINEMFELQATYHSKYVTTVEAPNIEGKHDDMSDALVRMVWLASNRLSKNIHMAGARRVAGPVVPAYNRVAVRRKQLQSGSVEARQIPRRGGAARKGRFR